jgi:uncharacterized protein
MERPFEFPSGKLRLEGRIGIPDSARGAAVVCHPHPQYGGSMDVPVVFAMASALRREGVATLRFNFRGVGGSEGAYGELVGEIEDARAAVAALVRETKLPSVLLVGYSFGAVVALRAGADESAVDRIAAIAPPARMFPLDFLAAVEKPILFVAGDGDQYTSAGELERSIGPLATPRRLIALAGADHFLYGFEDEIGHHVAEFATKGIPS